jgi:hypothetical protein
MKLVNEAPVGVWHSRRRHGENFEVEHELLPRSEVKLAMEPEGTSLNSLESWAKPSANIALPNLNRATLRWVMRLS